MWLAVRLAAREFRGGLRGFRIFLACLALGVAAIAAAGSVADAFKAGLASQAREVLGGDLSVTVARRGFTPAEQAVFARLGAVTYAVSVEAMGEAPSGERHLVELRGVAGPYPLAGRVELSGGASLAEVLAARDGGAASAAVEPELLQRLHLRLGDRFLVGRTPLIARAVLRSEPDRLSRGFALGPRVLTTFAAVQSGGFLDGAVPFGETARIALPPGADLAVAKAKLRAGLAAVGSTGHWRIGDRNDAAPGLKRMIDELGYFLGFIGLASLVAGGLGVQGAVAAHLDARKTSIATLKALGADSALPRNMFLIQIFVLALLGVAIGLAVGADTPLMLGGLIRRDLPVPAVFALYPAPLVRAAAFGLLSAAAFALAPLGRARSTPPAALFRHELSARPSFGPEVIGSALAACGLIALTVVTAPTPLAAAAMTAGVVAAFVGLWLLGLAAAHIAGGLRSRSRGVARIGVANLAGPGSAARTAAPAIGLGVALLSAVVLIQSSLLAQVSRIAPRTAPSMVFTGIPSDRGGAFDSEIATAMGGAPSPHAYLRAPFFSGRIVAVRGQPVERLRIEPDARWAFDRDLNMSVLGPEPLNAGVVRGHWWPAAYAGPPLAALSADIARGAGIRPGDEITLEVLGRRIDAKVAVVRRVDFAAFGASFPIVLDPAALAGADLRSVAIARASPAQEQQITAALGRDFPEVNVISVREALEEAAQIFDRLTVAIRAAAAVAALAGLLVLAGAIAARAQARAREATILKVLGATRAQILAAYAIEYGAVGLLAGIAGVALGCMAAWPVVVKVFEATWSLDWSGVATLVIAACLLATLGGVIAAAVALGRRPAPVLRTE
ncbi:MAG TPA: FtsX-like permease family protein [Caulobacteraceae bacterium]|jgi:putative ABC transport system permease protein